MSKIMVIFDYVEFHLVPALWFGLISVALYGAVGFLAETMKVTYEAIQNTITLHDKIAFGSGFCVMFLCVIVATVAAWNTIQYLIGRKGR